MDKRQALKILVENSYVLSQKTKQKLLLLVDNMTDEEVEEWGKLFSREQTFVAENMENILAMIDSIDS